ncbi:hypothetical protein [Patulibacter sp.]|uniref:hypothetical protein n=1 Tax=Patulibacter sp. TaxID=1912859 RepID=UPI002719A1D2|nr:hypothetical protein [Patulibacter sp.]MDO9410001.1 hypothetical protein [Patulibacter sp.]
MSYEEDATDRIVDGLRELPGVGPGVLEGRLTRLGLTIGPTGVQLRVAPNRQVLRDADGSTRLLDPLLAEWVRRR